MVNRKNKNKIFDRKGKLMRTTTQILKAYYSGQQVTVGELKKVPSNLLVMLDKKPSTKKLFDKIDGQ